MSTAADAPGSTPADGSLDVEVVYATPEQQPVVRLRVAAGCTVGEAIGQSGLVQRIPGLVVDPGAVGIFGRKVSVNQKLEDGDRVEIYRPLIADPKETRRRRARKG